MNDARFNGRLDRPEEPCTVVIFGASGDLTRRKLLPALYRLFLSQGLPTNFKIVGAARTEMTDESFVEMAMDACREAGVVDVSTGDQWAEFARRLFYQPLTYDDFRTYQGLARRLEELERVVDTGHNRIIYLAVPPPLYPMVAQMIGQAGLSQEKNTGSPGQGFSRIVVEKPFGRDLNTALELDRVIHQSFREHQIFRIDHYLAKESVQNVLTFRFANAIFEPVWNRRYISHVVISAAETLGVEHRAGYYEQAGVLRDMFQNHMMQLLALSAMEPPSRWEADLVRDEKNKVFGAMRPFPVKELESHVVLGQYGPGTVDGHRVPGYIEEPGVAPASLTPTFALLKTYIDNWRWQGVPFYLMSGKRLRSKLTRIDIQFREVPHSLFRDVLDQSITANRLTLAIKPVDRITLTFQTKSPGNQVALRSSQMRVDYYEGHRGLVMEPYEKVLLDVMLGDQILFWRQDGVEQCWSYLTPIIHECEAQCERKARPHPYWAGTWGPSEATRLIDLDPLYRD